MKTGRGKGRCAVAAYSDKIGAIGEVKRGAREGGERDESRRERAKRGRGERSMRLSKRKRGLQQHRNTRGYLII